MNTQLSGRSLMTRPAGLPGSKLRPATNKDGPVVSALIFGILRAYGLSPDPATTDADLADIEQTYRQRGGVFDVLVETATGKVIGSVGLLALGEGTFELRKMYLDGAFRRRGLGRYLMVRALAEARQRECRRLVLETASVLHEAIALYRQFGFVPYQPDHLAARCDLAMELTLSTQL
jgi:putative acetyltransferase